jgi:predicted ATPase/DNA-binding SARP family transcriptional activator
MPRLTIRLFGYPQFQVGGTPVRVERRKTLALAAYLAVETPPAGRSAVPPGVGRETLAALLWPDAAPDQAGAALRQALWDFAKSAGEEWLARNTRFVSLNPQADIRVDVLEFDILYTRWKTGSLENTLPAGGPAALLEQLTALYQAGFLAGFSLRDSPAFAEWATVQAERLRQRQQQALAGLVALHSQQDNFASAAVHAARWQALDPLDESACRASMLALARSGRRTDALQQYEAIQKVLAAELNVPPDPATSQLADQIRRGESFQVSGASYPPQANRSQLTADNSRPTGTVTFLFTDIEGSTHLWENQPEAMRLAHARHEAILRQSMAAYGGHVYKMIGDAFQVAFSTAQAALQAALAAQRALCAEAWCAGCQIKVRMALHTGVTEERADDYVGPTLNRVARLLSAGHGGQVLLNQTTCELVREHLPAQVCLRDLGEHTLKDLLQPEHIYQLEAPGLPAEFPALVTADRSTISLPVQSTPFVGRESELARIAALLAGADCRLVTLTGIGGIGKTRLAAQAACVAAGQPQFQGVYFVPLASCSTLDAMLSNLAEALKLAFYAPPGAGGITPAGARAQLFDFLGTKKTLLVLDNFEQLTGEAGFLLEMLQAAPQVKLLVTSRERLNLPGEWVLPVSGLAFPGREESELASGAPTLPGAALQLFVESAQRSAPFTPTPADWRAIARICQLVEGVPLAIEMAAAWLKLLSCQEIAAEIERDLDFLAATWRGMPERQRTFRSIFEHSWRLLPEEERHAFCQLAVFEGGFTREAALAVAAAPLPLLAALCDKSFVRRAALAASAVSSASGRFEIHPVLKQYAAEQLAAQPRLYCEVHARYAGYYSAWLERMNEKLKGSQQVSALAELRLEAQNLVGALRQLIRLRDYPRLQRAVTAMILYYEMNNQRTEFQEIVRLLGEVLVILSPAPAVDLPASPDPAQAELLPLLLATLRRFAGQTCPSLDAQQMQFFQEESLRLARQLPDCPAKGFALLFDSIGAGINTSAQNLALALECVAMFERLHDAWGVALAQLIAGDTANFARVDLKIGRTCYQAAQAIFSSMGNAWGQAMCLTGLAQIELGEDHPQEAYRLGCQSEEIYQHIVNPERSYLNRHILGEACQKMGALAQARQYFEANLAYALHIGDTAIQTYYRQRLETLG